MVEIGLDFLAKVMGILWFITYRFVLHFTMQVSNL